MNNTPVDELVKYLREKLPLTNYKKENEFVVQALEALAEARKVIEHYPRKHVARTWLLKWATTEYVERMVENEKAKQQDDFHRARVEIDAHKWYKEKTKGPGVDTLDLSEGEN